MVGEQFAMIWMNVKYILVRKYTGTNRILFTMADKIATIWTDECEICFGQEVHWHK